MNPDQSALIEKARESLQAARLLSDQGFNNFAVSRAYYAMFYVAEAFLLSEGLSFSKHAGVISAFGQHFVKTGRVPHPFHRYLIEGQASRNVGDYDLSANLSKAEAAELIRRAQEFVDLAQQLD